MAQIDDEQLQITFGIVGVGSAPIELLIHQARKMNIDRESLEAVPVVRFGLRPVVLDRRLVVVMSAAPLDVLQADAVIAVNLGEPGLEDMLDVFDLLPLDANELTTERLMSGAGRADDPDVLVVNGVGAPPVAIADFPSATANLTTGEGISPVINALLERTVRKLVDGSRSPRECPTLVLHATHHATGPDDLHPGAFPQPGARINLGVSLHEPFGDDWSCKLTGAVDSVVDPHTVTGIVTPAGDVPESLEGEWNIEMFREREIWILRSMQQL
jgi:hypothetical protein